MRTVANIAQQLMLELRDRKERWRRAVLLDQMQFDVFRYAWQKNRFDFSTFFTNSTAHFQHCYWRHMQPEAFTVKPDIDDIRRYGNAIQFGYESMDRQLGDFLRLDDGQTLFVLATALSQEPQLEYQDVGGWHFYRPYDAVALLRDLGIRYARLQSIMAQQYVLDLSSPAETEFASRRLRALTCDGQPLFHIIDKGPLSLGFGSNIKHQIPEHAVLSISTDEVTWSKRFYDLFYMIDGTKSGGHNPRGLLWFKTGHHHVYSEPVELMDVFPTLLEELGVQPPGDTALPGRSLSKQINSRSNAKSRAAA